MPSHHALAAEDTLSCSEPGGGYFYLSSGGIVGITIFLDIRVMVPGQSRCVGILFKQPQVCRRSVWRNLEEFEVF